MDTAEPVIFNLDASMVSPGSFALWVKGNSMTGDNINEGDIVVVDPSRPVQDGDIVAAYIENWAHTETGRIVEGRLLKRLRDGGKVLESSNPDVPPMTLRPDHNLRIDGRVVGVIKIFTPEPADLTSGWREWVSPNDVRHLVPPTGPCATCGQNHDIGG